MSEVSMTSRASHPWHEWSRSLYKFRALGQWAVEIVERPHLYFSPIKNMGDRTEVGAEMIIPEDQAAILKHLEEYRTVLRESRAFEYRLYMKQMLKWEEDIEAPIRASRRVARVRDFDARLAHTNGLIELAEGSTGSEAKKTMMELYDRIKLGLRDAAVCCVTKHPKSPKMWEEYADHHRGVCFKFSDRLFQKDKKVERTDVLYTADGRLRPLDMGYLNSYRSLYSTKHLAYSHEDEVRFFLFGEPRPLPVKSADLLEVIFGSEALTPLSDAKSEDQRKKNVSALCHALDQRNARRNYEHRTLVYVASWVGYELHLSGVSTSQLLKDHA